jgi:spore germination cell wall hydrolase CwlJ-like protein
MTQITKTDASSAAQSEVRTRNRNPDPAARAAGRCRLAWQTAHDNYMQEHSTGKEKPIALAFIDFEADIKAAAAYRDTMPSFSSRESIQCFIACVAYGVIFEVFTESLSSKLLYAAHVAIAALPREPKPSGRPPIEATQ